MFFRDLNQTPATESRKSPAEPPNPLELERLLQVLETCVERQAMVIQSLANGEDAA